MEASSAFSLRFVFAPGLVAYLAAKYGQITRLSYKMRPSPSMQGTSQRGASACSQTTCARLSQHRLQPARNVFSSRAIRSQPGRKVRSVEFENHFDKEPLLWMRSLGDGYIWVICEWRILVAYYTSSVRVDIRDQMTAVLETVDFFMLLGGTITMLCQSRKDSNRSRQ